ncbi:MAG TPA: CapA family protein [Deltaproteobacteria bacterium]|nr:CapA family protein [Deltaproteobacteria bacterium]
MGTGTLLIGFVGDIALTHGYDGLYRTRGPHYPFAPMERLLKRHDVLVGNLEAPFCLGGETYPMKLGLRSHPGYAEGLKGAGFSVLTLGNNHVLDYLEQALFETLGIIDKSGLVRCGAGADLREARRPALIGRKGVTVGVLSCCDVAIDSPFYAAEGVRGIAPLDMEVLEEDIRALRREADIVVVSPHWGKEDWRYPHPVQVEQARRMIDCGAHLVVGHHPHVLQGVERYGHGFIAYSLGNFLFPDLQWEWRNAQGEPMRARMRQGRARRRGALLSVEAGKDGVRRVELVPCRTGSDLRARPEGRAGGTGLLSLPLGMKHYPELWALYDRMKSVSVVAAGNARRLRNIRKLRPAHLRELAGLLRGLMGREAP